MIDIGNVRQFGTQPLFLTLTVVIRHRYQRAEISAECDLLHLGHGLAPKDQHCMFVKGVDDRGIVNCRDRLGQIDAANFRHEQRMQFRHRNHARLPRWIDAQG